VILAFDGYTKTIENHAGYSFIVVAPSREDTEILVCFVGFEGQEMADRAIQVSEAIHFFCALKALSNSSINLKVRPLTLHYKETIS
jgi:hypothetical protein